MPVELADVFKTFVAENEPTVASHIFEASQEVICKRRRSSDKSDAPHVQKFRRGSQSTLSYTPDLLYAIENHIETGCTGTASGATTPTDEDASESGISKSSLAHVLLASAVAATAESARAGEPKLLDLQPTLLLYRYADYVRPTPDQMEQLEAHFKRAIEKDSPWREFSQWRGLLDARKFWKEIAVVALYFAAGTTVAVELETLFEVTSMVIRPSMPWIVSNEPSLAMLLYEIFPGIKNHVPSSMWKRGFVDAAYVVGLAATAETPFLLQRYYDLSDACGGGLCWEETSLDMSLQVFMEKDFTGMFLKATRKGAEDMTDQAQAILDACDDLFPEEIKSVLTSVYENYTGPGYVDTNAVLRNDTFVDNPRSFEQMAHVALILFFWFRAPRDLVLYRGQVLEKDLPGTLCVRGFYSCSTDKSVAFRFAHSLKRRSKSAVIEIIVRAGQPVIPFVMKSLFKDESEIALLPGAKLVIDEGSTPYTVDSVPVTRYMYESGDVHKLVTMEEAVTCAKHIFRVRASPDDHPDELRRCAHSIWHKLKAACKGRHMPVRYSGLKTPPKPKLHK
ncbi:hypothetical protein JKP88DRAFT_243891 [Tribonema minus]|uniref:Uncharacterized protein n=1 Tax=Tribonema minus TaxID=303371 RepID=A0A836CIL8_9STRA|nr:hypothetical protein JKP88DRAFT_243891 [Tribonema minus]